VLRALPAALLLALVVAGCGAAPSSTEDFQGEERRVAAAVEALQEAGQDDDARRICTAVLTPARARALRPNCVAAVEQAVDDADSFEVNVTDVTVRGATATARVEVGRDAEVRTFRLVRQGRNWRIDALGTPPAPRSDA